MECKGGGVFVEVYDEWDWEHRVKFGRYVYLRCDFLIVDSNARLLLVLIFTG